MRIYKILKAIKKFLNVVTAPKKEADKEPILNVAREELKKPYTVRKPVENNLFITLNSEEYKKKYKEVYKYRLIILQTKSGRIRKKNRKKYMEGCKDLQKIVFKATKGSY